MLLFLESIGTGEIVLIFLFILIFFGAKSIPGMAQGLGKFIRQVKDASQNIQDEITKSTSEMKREMNANKALSEARKTIENPARELTEGLKRQGKEIQKKMNQSITEDSSQQSKPKTDIASNNKKDQPQSEE